MENLNVNPTILFLQLQCTTASTWHQNIHPSWRKSHGLAIWWTMNERRLTLFWSKTNHCQRSKPTWFMHSYRYVVGFGIHWLSSPLPTDIWSQSHSAVANVVPVGLSKARRDDVHVPAKHSLASGHHLCHASIQWIQLNSFAQFR